MCSALSAWGVGFLCAMWSMQCRSLLKQFGICDTVTVSDSSTLEVQHVHRDVYVIRQCVGLHKHPRLYLVKTFSSLLCYPCSSTPHPLVSPILPLITTVAVAWCTYPEVPGTLYSHINDVGALTAVTSHVLPSNVPTGCAIPKSPSWRLLGTSQRHGCTLTWMPSMRRKQCSRNLTALQVILPACACMSM